MACITLLSDLGLQDASVAIAKGILMQYNPVIPIADISHDVTPFHRGQAAYLLSAAYNNFPPGTIHVILFNLFAETPPRLVLSEKDGHYFLSPGNGPLPITNGEAGNSWMCYELKQENTFIDWLHTAGAIIQQLQEKNPADLGLPSYRLKDVPGNSLTVNENEVDCDIIHIDRFENVVINITMEQFETLRKGRDFRLQFMQVEELTEISGNYNDVRTGYKLCRFNSNGYIEIGINRGKAASLFGLRLGAKNNDIKIFFE